jgi:hypothetical protein
VNVIRKPPLVCAFAESERANAHREAAATLVCTLLTTTAIMRGVRKPPRFALVLSALLAASALAIVLADRGNSRQPTGNQPPTISSGPSHACITTRAEATSINRSAIVVSAKVEQPVNVTEQASGPKGIATVTRSEVVSATIRADEPVEVKRTAVAHARACANGESQTAARATALRTAYARALAAAHAAAARQAARSLAALIKKQYPTVLANARTKAGAKAHQLGLKVEASLEAKAKAEARRRAGD